jgi:hypothetical protein
MLNGSQFTKPPTSLRLMAKDFCKVFCETGSFFVEFQSKGMYLCYK